MSRQEDFQNFLNSSVTSMEDLMQLYVSMGKDYLGPVGDIALYNLKSDYGWASNPYDALNQQIKDFTPTFINELRNLSGFSRSSLPPAFQDVMNNLDNLQGDYQSIINAGGRTAETGAALARLGEILSGATPEQKARFDTANLMLQNQGFTAGLTEMQNIARQLTVKGGMTENLSALAGAGRDILAQGGRTAGIEDLATQGKAILSSGGMTPELRDMLGQIQGQLGAGGFSPEMRQVFDQAGKIISAGGQGGALLPMETVVSMARDAAATAAGQRAESVRREAISRGGASVFAGGTAQAMAEFSDEALRAEGAATREAALGQQGLQLQQLQMAFQTSTALTQQASAVTTALMGMGVDVARIASQNLAVGGSLMQNAEQLAMQRLALGGSMVTDAEGQALARMTSGLGSLAGIEQLAGQFRTDAMNQLAQLTQDQLIAARGIGDFSKLETDRLFAGLAGKGTTIGMGADVLSQQQTAALRNLLAQGDIFYQGVNTQGTMLNQINQNTLNYLNLLRETGTPFLNLANTAIGNQGQLLNTGAEAYGQKFLQPGLLEKLGTSFAGGFGQAFGAGLSGGIGTAMGNWFSTPKTGTT